MFSLMSGLKFSFENGSKQTMVSVEVKMTEIFSVCGGGLDLG